VLFLSRLIDGVTGGNISTAGAYIADVSQPHERASNFALMGLAWGLGFVIGPALGTAASVISLDSPAYLAGIISLLSVAAMWFALPESLPLERRVKAPLSLASLNPFKSIGQISSKPGMPVLMAVMLAFSFAFAALSSIQNVFVARQFSVTPEQIGIWLLLGGIGTAVSQFFLSDRAFKRFGERGMGLASLAIQGMGVALLIATPAFVLLMFAAPVLGMLRPFIWGGLGALMAVKVQPREQGVLSGVNTALQSATSIFGPMAAGALYDLFSPQAPMLMSLVFFVLAFAILSSVKPALRTGGMPTG
jgi:predicted MFS family arabinose efflux permease